MAGRAALITGACGFVGRQLTRSLAQDFDEIWMVDDLSTGRHPDTWLPALLGGADGVGERPRVYTGRETVVRFFNADVIGFFGTEIGVGAVAGERTWPVFAEAYHLASIVGGRVKIEREPLTVGLDLAIDSIFFLWVARHARVERLLYASSSAAYPVDLQSEDGAISLQERHIDFAANRIAMPDMTYGWSKLTGEYLTFLLARHHGIPCCAVRPFSGYGEEQDLAYPVPAIAGRAAAREDPLVVWGSGHQGRDFVHIEDCVHAMRLAIGRIEDGSGVNIGSGRLTTFLEVARTFADLAGYEPEVRGTMDGPVGVHARHADIEVATARLGWTPSITLEAGFARVLAAQERRLTSRVG